MTSTTFATILSITIRVTGSAYEGLYDVRASDAVVIAFLAPKLHDDFATPKLTRRQAEAIAVEFLRRVYPLFTRSRWRAVPDYQMPNVAHYGFSWTRILNDFGTLAPRDVWVEIDGVDGRVVTYFRPADRPINCPTVPRISAEQARQIAAQHAIVDVRSAPLRIWECKVWEDIYGIHTLRWTVIQNTDPRDPLYGPRYTIDAMTGEYQGKSVPIGFSTGNRMKTPVVGTGKKPNFDLAPTIRISSGRAVHPSVRPVVQSGVLWVRVEALRGLGASVQADCRGVEIVVGELRLCGSEAGAERRDYGWWVPLRRVSESLGWRVEWKPQTREAVVFTQESR
jgi:hypothetical protein